MKKKRGNWVVALTDAVDIAGILILGRNCNREIEEEMRNELYVTSQ